MASLGVNTPATCTQHMNSQDFPANSVRREVHGDVVFDRRLQPTSFLGICEPQELSTVQCGGSGRSSGPPNGCQEIATSLNFSRSAAFPSGFFLFLYFTLYTLLHC